MPGIFSSLTQNFVCWCVHVTGVMFSFSPFHEKLAASFEIFNQITSQFKFA